MNIISIFYNEIIPEALNGRIDAFFYYNILFETFFIEDNDKNKTSLENMLVPVLVIHNKNVFNDLLIKYTNMCLKFYDDTNFAEEVNNDSHLKVKTILALLWSDATYDDFMEPEIFLRKRISFMNNKMPYDKYNFGRLDVLNGELSVTIEKDRIYNETPYKLSFIVDNKTEKYEFPEIKFGIEDDKVYIYAIQRKSSNDNGYAKKVNRTLYQIGENFNNDERLKDVTASFLVALNMAVSLLQSEGYQKIIAPSILLTRYNAKKIMIERKKNRISNEEYLSLQNMHDVIQNNLTDKFMRTFLRLNYYYDNMNIESYPTQIDSNLHLFVDGPMRCDNKLLNESARIVSQNVSVNQVANK